MSQDVTQWLAEIKALKQQLAEAQQQQQQAYASAANWQRLYETEAQQRRTEANLAKQTIAELQQKLQKLQNYTTSEASTSDTIASHQSEVAEINSVEDLRARLLETLAERDRLLQALKTEQTNHDQTRRGLTTALGDAIDLLSRHRGERGE
jgi:DNA repair exonuclease SbcCD ATPase subunit